MMACHEIFLKRPRESVGMLGPESIRGVESLLGSKDDRVSDRGQAPRRDLQRRLTKNVLLKVSAAEYDSSRNASLQAYHESADNAYLSEVWRP